MPESQARTRAAFAQDATRGTVGAVSGYFAPVQTMASRFSHHDATLSVAHGLAECAHAMLLSLQKKVRDAPAPRGAGVAAGPQSYGRPHPLRAATARNVTEFDWPMRALRLWRSNP
jgi:hypothetical protein